MPTIGGDSFSAGCDMMEVTSIHRPDTSWRVIDAQGHEHRWYIGGLLGVPALSYSPSTRYDTPTLIWVKDGEEYWEDDDVPHDVGHLECRQCGEHVNPGYRADDTHQYIPGLRWYRINGTHVSQEEFERRLAEAQQRGT